MDGSDEEVDGPDEEGPPDEDEVADAGEPSPPPRYFSKYLSLISLRVGW